MCVSIIKLYINIYIIIYKIYIYLLGVSVELLSEMNNPPLGIQQILLRAKEWGGKIMYVCVCVYVCV